MKPTSSRKIKEIRPEQLEFDSNFIKDKLCPKLWSVSKELDPQLREKLLDIANRFYRFLNIDTPIVDILLTGSLAGFDWNNEKSDIDVHLVVNFEDIGNEKFVRGVMNSKKLDFNTMRRGVRIKGFQVECYCQDVNEFHKPSGLYSLKDGKWLIQPERVAPDINMEMVRQIISVLLSAINNLEHIEDNQMRLDKAIELKNSIIAMRRVSVRKRNEFAEPNLAFKSLRRAGHIDRLFDIIRIALDEKLSLAEAKRVSGSMLQEGSSSDKQIRELVRKELELLMKKEQKSNDENIRDIVRKTLWNYHKYMFEKKGIWIKQI